MTLYQKMLMFYAVMATISALITWFLSKDRKRIRFLSAFLVGSTWPMKALADCIQHGQAGR